MGRRGSIGGWRLGGLSGLDGLGRLGGRGSSGRPGRRGMLGWSRRPGRPARGNLGSRCRRPGRHEAPRERSKRLLESARPARTSAHEGRGHPPGCGSKRAWGRVWDLRSRKPRHTYPTSREAHAQRQPLVCNICFDVQASPARDHVWSRCSRRWRMMSDSSTAARSTSPTARQRNAAACWRKQCRWSSRSTCHTSRP